MTQSQFIIDPYSDPRSREVDRTFDPTGLTDELQMVGSDVAQPFGERLMIFAGFSPDSVWQSRNPIHQDRKPIPGDYQTDKNTLDTYQAKSIIDTFGFQINPSRLQRTKKKNQQAIFLGRGADDPLSSPPIDFHYLGNQYETFSYSGFTPAFSPLQPGATPGVSTVGGINTQFTDYTNSPGWAWFNAFQDFFDNNADQNVVMRYLNGFYVGTLDSLRFTRDAEAPFNIQYSFVFQSFKEYVFNIQTVTPGSPKLPASPQGTLKKVITVSEKDPKGVDSTSGLSSELKGLISQCRPSFTDSLAATNAALAIGTK